MALRAGRVGVAPSEVDPNGKVKSTGGDMTNYYTKEETNEEINKVADDIYIRYNSDTGLPEWKERGADTFNPFSSGCDNTFDAGMHGGTMSVIFLTAHDDNNLDDLVTELYTDSSLNNKIGEVKGSIIIIKNAPTYLDTLYFKVSRGTWKDWEHAYMTTIPTTLQNSFKLAIATDRVAGGVFLGDM